MADVAKKNSCPQCGANIRKQAKFCPTCGATLLSHQGASPLPRPHAQPRGDILFQDAAEVKGDVIIATEMHKHTSQLMRVGAPVIAMLVVSVALIALTQVSGYSVRTWLHNGAQTTPTPRMTAQAVAGNLDAPTTTMKVNYYEKANHLCAQAGDQISIVASGLLKVGTFAGDGGYVGPEGTERGFLSRPIGNSYDLVATFPHAALMYRIAGETAWRSYADPTTRTFTAPIAGCLEFRRSTA